MVLVGCLTVKVYILLRYKMTDIINYIVAHPLYCLALGFLCILAWNLSGFNSTATNNKRSALIDKHYRKNFKK